MTAPARRRTLITLEDHFAVQEKLEGSPYATTQIWDELRHRLTDFCTDNPHRAATAPGKMAWLGHVAEVILCDI